MWQKRSPLSAVSCTQVNLSRKNNNINADSLSHLPCGQCGHESYLQQTPIAATFLSVVEYFGQLQLDDATLGPVLRAKQQGQKPPASEIKSTSRGSRRLFQIWNQLMLREQILYHQYDGPGDGEAVQQLVILESCKKTEVFKDMHEVILGGHLGEEKKLGHIRERFYWPCYHNDVCDWCKTCSECAAKKPPAPKRRAPLLNIKVGSPLNKGVLDHFSRKLYIFFVTSHNFFSLSSVQIIIIPACCLLCVL